MGKILIVDDDQATSKLLEYILTKEGYDVITLNDGCDMVSVAGRHNPNLILLDLMMPSLDGLEVCRNLRAESQFTRIPIIFFTSVSDIEKKVAAIGSGANGATKLVNNILNRMTTQFVTPSGTSMFIHTRVRLRFEFAAFLGARTAKISMMESAENSLQRSMEVNMGDLFQNLFIEWQTVGELSLPTPLFEKVISYSIPEKDLAGFNYLSFRENIFIELAVAEILGIPRSTGMRGIRRIYGYGFSKCCLGILCLDLVIFPCSSLYYLDLGFLYGRHWDTFLVPFCVAGVAWAKVYRIY